MSAGTITFKEGTQRERGENEFAGPDGTYAMMLVRVSEPYEDTSQFSRTGKGTYRRWTFAVDDGGEFDSQELELRTSNSNSDQSKQFEVVQALIGRNPTIGNPIDIDTHLVGKSALVYVVSNDAGYPKIDKLLALPKAKPAAKAAPTAAAVDDTDDALPF